MPMYNLIKYSENYSKTSVVSWQYSGDQPALANNGDTTDFTGESAITDSFRIKEKRTGQTGNSLTEKVEIMVPLKYLSIFLENS